MAKRLVINMLQTPSKFANFRLRDNYFQIREAWRGFCQDNLQEIMENTTPLHIGSNQLGKI
ncbi:hypothetical protein HMPREF0645_2155 [Hallella bergensis DSM 17361]|uniref:Uncharacterized protein n=1 Tax=Hallella bergensis DSM 17361 TaxID=585502 RepID=D1PYX0_9BACT|nr:hypothetical protein HMPREF0645_2155 [Hallella bergensis DSM 17361]